MKTTAPKNFSLWARIEKEILREIDRAPRARIFTLIARSRVSALEAIVRDHVFRAAAQIAHRCQARS
jgi:hypothetical protein